MILHEFVDQQVLMRRALIVCRLSASTSVESWSEKRRSRDVAASISRCPVANSFVGPTASIKARNCKALARPQRLRSQLCPSPTTKVVVTNRGGSASNSLKSGCQASERSANAISAELSTNAISASCHIRPRQSFGLTEGLPSRPFRRSASTAWPHRQGSSRAGTVAAVLRARFRAWRPPASQHRARRPKG